MKNFSFGRAKGIVCLLAGTACAVSVHAAEHSSCPYKPQVPITRLQQTITGTVADHRGALPGVTISIKGKTALAITDANGHFTINADLNDVLIFTFVGYKTTELTVQAFTPLKITLEEDAMTLQEVTVNAGYYTVKEKERTGSIAKITSKDIETQPVTNVLAAMQGRMAGVNITQTTGVPGGGFNIEIRGLNSLRANGNSPLFIIDGVPYATDPIGTGINSNVLPTQPSPLNSINPDQIESIEVLKDADATAIYGSRGANGVVLVTTKKGKAGKTRVTVNLSQGAGVVTRKIDLLSTRQYLEMRQEAYANDGIDPIPDYAYDANGTWGSTRNTDWQKTLIGGTAEFTDMHATLSEGNEHTQFLASANFNKQGSVYPEDFTYKKGNVHLNVNHASENRRFKSSFTVGYTLQDNNQPRLDLTYTALQLAPNAPALYDEDGNLNWENNTFENPLAQLEGQYRARTYDLIGSANLSYAITDGLELKSNFGYTQLLNRENTTSPSTRFNPSYGMTSASSTHIASRAERRSWIIEPQLNWKKAWRKTKFDILAGTTFQSQTGSQLVQYAAGFASNSLIDNLAAASALFTLADDETEYRYQAVFGRINLNHDGRYLLNLTGRRDGSSRFGDDRRFANFGAVGAAWVFSEEAFLKNSVLSFGKLRGSYGITGNDQIGDYHYLDTYSASGNSYDGTIGLQPTQLYNPNFGWETNKKLEGAVELGFWGDRILVTASYFRNRSSNQLTGIPLPATTGFSSVQANLDATVLNYGTEFTLRTVNVKDKDFEWTSSFNISFLRNKLLSFPDLESSTYAFQYVVGQPLYIKRAYHYTGVDPQTGLYTFEDVNGDGNYTSLEDKKTIVDLNPEYFGGLQNSLRYKRWNLNFLFQFVKQQNYGTAALFGVPGSGANQPASVMDRWQQPGDIASHQVFTDGSNGEAVEAYFRYVDSDGALTDASFVRLKNLSLSYDLPDNLLKNLRCRIFAEGQNLLTFTPYKGGDPEFRQTGYLPPLRTITAGVQFSF